MYTMKDLCKKSNLARSTLLYYDSLGLLKPCARNSANYRLYSEESLKTLERICLYREAGVGLSEIAQMINTPENDDINKEILEKTLCLLNKEAREVREKQDIIIKMLNRENDSSQPLTESRRELVFESLSLLGLNDSSVTELHVYLEKQNPQAHLDFLEAMGFSAEEIEHICERARMIAE